MHQISLYGQIPAARHEQLLKILAGIAAMPPQIVKERHLIFKPVRPPVRRVLQVGASQGIQDPHKLARQAQANGDQYFLRLVEDLSRDQSDGDETQADGDVYMRDEDSKIDWVKHRWELRFYDVPEPGERPNTTQLMSKTQVVKGDAVAFMAGLGYECIHHYVLTGHRLIHNNATLLLNRIRTLPSPSSLSQEQLSSFTVPALKDLPLLDQSGAYTLQAYVRVQDGNRPEMMAKASTEVAQFKELMKGVIDMRPARRLALDTRVK